MPSQEASRQCGSVNEEVNQERGRMEIRTHIDVKGIPSRTAKEAPAPQRSSRPRKPPDQSSARSQGSAAPVCARGIAQQDTGTC